MERFWLIDTEIFLHPFTCLIVGPAQSGKTSLLKNLLLHSTILISPNPEKIIYCYSVWQPMFDEIKNLIKNIEFCEGIYNIDQVDASVNTLIIFDDLMKECESDPSIFNLFTIDSHHKNISVFLISHNLFSKGKFTRTISLNSSYIIVFKNPRDKSQLYVLARQMFPDKIKYFMEAVDDSINSRGHSYIFLDLKQTTLEKNRVQSGILPGEQRIIYTPK